MSEGRLTLLFVLNRALNRLETAYPTRTPVGAFALTGRI
jgi:hypothetical protein